MRLFPLLMIFITLGIQHGLAIEPTPSPATADQTPLTYISSLAWSPDGNQIAIGKGTDSCELDSDLYTIQILDALTGEVVQNLAGSTCSITDMDWSPDNTKLAASSLDGWGLRVWDVQTRNLLATVQRGGQGVTSVRWRPDGLQLVVGTVSNGAALIDPGTGEVTGTPPIGGTSLDWNPDGSKLVSGSSIDFQVYVADMVTDQEIMVLQGHMGAMSTVSWSPDGRKLASAGGIDDPIIRIWDATSGTNLFALQGHMGAVRAIVWSPDSTRLASASSDKTVYIWDLPTGQILETFAYPGGVYALDWSPDGTQIVYGGSNYEGQTPQLEIVTLTEETLPTSTP